MNKPQIPPEKIVILSAKTTGSAKKGPKPLETFYINILRRNEVRSLHLTGHSTKEIVAITKLNEATVLRIMASEETKAVMGEILKNHIMDLSTNLLIKKAILATSRRLDKEITEQVDDRAFEILKRTSIIPDTPQDTVFSSTSTTHVTENHMVATGSLRDFANRLVEHVATQEQNFPATLTEEIKEEKL